MPVSPQHPCNHPGCNVLVDDTHCPRHAEQRDSLTRAKHRAYKSTRTDGTFYSTVQWRTVRARQLADHPLCVGCATHGRVRAATMVDHRLPIKGGGAPFDPANLQSMCMSCHNSKTGEENKNRAKKR